MGTRITFQIGTNQEEEVTCAVLSSNSCTDKVDAEAIFRKETKEAIGPNDLIERLMTYAYPEKHGTHEEGDKVFRFNGSPGDYEKVLCATWDDESKTANIDVMEMTSQEEQQVLIESIVGILSGQEWDSETTSDIAELLRANGHKVEDID